MSTGEDARFGMRERVEKTFAGMKDWLDPGGNQSILRTYPEYDDNFFYDDEDDNGDDQYNNNDDRETRVGGEEEQQQQQQQPKHHQIMTQQQQEKEKEKEKEIKAKQEQAKEINAVNALNRYRSQHYSERKHKLINYVAIVAALLFILVSLLGMAVISYNTQGTVWDQAPPHPYLFSNPNDPLYGTL